MDVRAVSDTKSALTANTSDRIRDKISWQTVRNDRTLPNHLILSSSLRGPLMASTGYLIVDDADERINYSSGWQASLEGGATDGTKHGATDAGMTATFTFTGKHLSAHPSSDILTSW